MNRLFALAFDKTENGNKNVERESHRKYFLPRNISYNALIDDRNFSDQSINDQIEKYDEIRKIATEKEMITQLVPYWIINTLKIIAN